MKQLVISMTDPSKKYEVDLEKETCNCPAYAKGKTRPCKHLVELGVKPKKKKVVTSYVKSAIQKAYRRNDQPLLIWSFNWLWKNERNWIWWRYMVLPAEDHWKGVVEMGRAHDEAKMVYKHDPVGAKHLLLCGLLNTMAQKKSQDSNGIRQLADVVRSTSQVKTPHLMGAIIKKVDVSQMLFFEFYRSISDPVAVDAKGLISPIVWETIWHKVAELKESGISLGKYVDLCDGIKAMQYRAAMGGGPGYTTLFLAVIALQLYYTELGRSITGEPSDEVLSSGEWITPHVTPPWCCLDMHTGPGKRVLGYITKIVSNTHMDGAECKAAVEEIWFINETALVNETDEDSVWWKLGCNAYLIQHGVKPKEMKKLWDEKLRDIVRKKIILWS